MEVEEKLITFLKSNEVYDHYVHNLNSIGPYSEIDLNKPKSLISAAFSWTLSNEGFDFWLVIHKKWWKECSNG